MALIFFPFGLSAMPVPVLVLAEARESLGEFPRLQLVPTGGSPKTLGLNLNQWFHAIQTKRNLHLPLPLDLPLSLVTCLDVAVLQMQGREIVDLLYHEV